MIGKIVESVGYAFLISDADNNAVTPKKDAKTFTNNDISTENDIKNYAITSEILP